MSLCAYCGNPATEPDHLISRNQTRGNQAAARCRDLPRYIVPSCHECNFRKLTAHRVATGMEELIPELEAITGNTYTVWDGDPATLYAEATP